MAQLSAGSGTPFSIERHSIDYIGVSERHGRVWDQGPFWFTANFQFMSVSLGFVGPAMGLSLGWTTLAATLGLLVGTLFMAFHATQGPSMGLPQMIQSRAQFGYRGVVLPLTASLVNCVGFNVILALLIMSGVRDLFGLDRHVVLAIMAVFSAALAFYGYDWFHLAFKAVFWTSLPLFAILSGAIVLGRIPHATPPMLHFSWVGFGVEFATCASYNLNLAVYVSDYSRYLRRDTPASKIIASVFVGAVTSAIWLVALGAWLTTRLGATDPMIAVWRAGNELSPGFGTLIAITSVLLMLTLIAMQSYSGMLTLITWLDCLRPVKPTVTIRGICTLVITVLWVGATIAVGDNAISALMLLLTIMLYLLVPWTAVNLVDYFFVRSGHYAITDMFTPDGIYGSWGWKGLSAYLLGWVAMVPFAALPGVYTGPIAHKLHGVDIAWLVSLLTSSLVYFLLTRSFVPELEEAAIATSELALEGTPRESATECSAHSVGDIGSQHPLTIPAR
jgi:nucleobase:cation symporter-1, NCS1 family